MLWPDQTWQASPRWGHTLAGLRSAAELRARALELVRSPTLLAVCGVLLGRPSLIIDDGTVLCYAADKDTDPLVRSLRISGQPFEDGLILSLYGKVLRWGPGWWIDHPDPSKVSNNGQ